MADVVRGSPRAVCLVAGVLSLFLLATLSSCADPADDGPGTGGPSASHASAELPRVRPVPAVTRLVPKDLRSRGKLVLATSAPYPPMEYFETDNKTLTGFDIDIGDAIGAAMGLRTEWKNISFDSIIPGLQAGKYDAAMDGFSATYERLGTVDMVSYYLTGGGFLVRKGAGVAVGSFDGLCGYRVAVKKGVSQVQALNQANHDCAKNGKKPITILQIPDQNVAVLTLQSGRADVVVADKPQVEHAAEQSGGTLCVSGDYQTSHSIAGIAVPKGHPRLLLAFKAAVNALLRSGAYAKVAAVWGTGQAERTSVSPAFAKLLAPWGVGRDGTIHASRVFTHPDQISDRDHYFYQPVHKGCA